MANPTRNMANPTRNRLIAGPWHPDLEARLLDEVRARKAADPLRPVVVLVGSNIAGLYLSRRLALLGTPHVGTRFLTWLDLARELAEDALLAAGLRPLPPHADLFAAAELAARLPSGAYFAPVAGRPGFHRALQRTLGDLASAGWIDMVEASAGSRAAVGASAAARAAASFPLLDDQPRKVGELVDLLRGYRDLLRGRCFDASDLLRAAAEHAGGFRRRFGCDELLVYGVHRVHELQWRLLDALAAQVRITAFVPLGGRFLAAAPRDFARRLQAAGFRVEAAAAGATPSRETISASPSVLARVQAWAAGDDDRGPWPAPDESFAVVSAPTPAAEAHAAVREVVSLAESGVPLHEIGVLARDLDAYGPLLRQALGRARVDAYLPEGERLSRQGAGLALLGWLSLAAGDLPRGALMEWLMSSPLRFDRALPGVVDPPVALWDRLTAEAGIVGGHRRWREALAAIGRRYEADRAVAPAAGPSAATGAASDHAGGDTSPDQPDTSLEDDEGSRAPAADLARLRAASASLRRFIGEFLQRIERFPRTGTWGEFVAATLGVLDFYLQPAPHVREVVEGLAGLDVLGLRVDLARFTRALEAALDRQAPPVGSFQRGAVTVIDVARARGLSFRAVVVVGLNERAFPRPVRQDPLLLDHERRALNDAVAAWAAAGGAAGLPARGGGTVCPQVAPTPDGEDDLLFAAAIGSARERLVLTFARGEPSGERERTPSRHLLQLAGACLGRPAELADVARLPGFRRIAGGPAGWAGPATDALDRRGYDIAALAAGEPGAAESLRLIPAVASARAAGIARFSLPGLTGYDGRISPTSGRVDDLESAPVAPTSLETYLTCPMRYFAMRVLGLRKWEEPDEVVSISPLDRGELVHTVLERTYRRAVEAGLVPLQPDRGPAMRVLLGEEFERACRAVEARGAAGLPVIWAHERAAILADLEAFLERDLLTSSGWTPQAFEVDFGADREVAWQTAGGQRLRFRGRIDRVDVRRARGGGDQAGGEEHRGAGHGDAPIEAVRVIDYKSGRLPKVSDDLEGGERLQLPIYLLAAQRMLGLDSLRRCAAEYASTGRRGKFERATLDGAAWERIERVFGRAVEVAAEGIAAGWFFPYPGKGDRHCQHCDVRPICPQAVARQFERKAGAPELRAFLELKEERA